MQLADQMIKRAAGVACEVSVAAQDLYGQAADSASQVADATTRAARKTAGSFEKALRNTIKKSAIYGRRSCARSGMAVRQNAPPALTLLLPSAQDRMSGSKAQYRPSAIEH
jgi:hypothetical protein